MKKTILVILCLLAASTVVLGCFQYVKLGDTVQGGLLELVLFDGRIAIRWNLQDESSATSPSQRTHDPGAMHYHRFAAIDIVWWDTQRDGEVELPLLMALAAWLAYPLIVVGRGPFSRMVRRRRDSPHSSRADWVWLSSAILFAAAFLATLQISVQGGLHRDLTVYVGGGGLGFVLPWEPSGMPSWIVEGPSGIPLQILPTLRSSTLFIPFWIPFGLASIGTWRRWRRYRSVGAADCRNCGYNLTGNITGTCPECGVDAALSQTSPQP